MTSTIDHHGVDVCVDEEVLMQAPHCPHGPTLLFERFVPGKQPVERYYACSACRDRKDCGFFQLYSDSEIISETKKLMREEYNKSRQPWRHQNVFYQRFQDTEKLTEGERKFCYDCQLLVLPHEGGKHKHHSVKTGISSMELARPSFLLEAIENNKTNAQYLFSTKAVKFLAHTIKSLGFRRVLCIGVPRLHEHISCDDSSGLESRLLDIDHRYGQFYPPSRFCRYNMFNHFFLDGPESQEVCREFLARNGGEGVVMVTDPPFGGLVDALASGVRWIMQMWQSSSIAVTGRDLPVMWIFPYFLEQRIVENLSGLKMLDYKVDYDNHPLFKTGPDAKKKGSPVRIFTNLDPTKIALPASEGYRFCKLCQRHVAPENQHCSKCGVCPSKNGSTYRHCGACNRCVKPSFSHCAKCGKCELSNHNCGRPVQGCHVCGSFEHKRRGCPKRSQSIKRSRDDRGDGEASFLRTWPKRKKKELVRPSVKSFRPAEDVDVMGSPQTKIPAQFKFGKESSAHTLLCDVFKHGSTSKANGSSPSAKKFASPAVSSLTSADTSSSVTGFMSDFTDSQDENGNQTCSNIATEQSPLSFASTDCGNDNGNSRSPGSSGKKSKVASKKSKLMQMIQKMRMKRKIKLKI